MKVTVQEPPPRRERGAPENDVIAAPDPPPPGPGAGAVGRPGVGGLGRRAPPRREDVRPRACASRGSFVEPFLRQVRRELRQRGLRFRPHFWLSDEWFCPDGVPGIAIPFYLAHPRLARLEQHADARGRGRHAASGACASCATRPATRSRTPTGCAAASAAASSSAAARSRTPSTTRPGPTAGASWSTSSPGTRRAIPTRTSPRPSRCGSPRARTGASATRAGRRCAKLEYVDELMRGDRGPAAASSRRGGEVEPLRSLTQDAARALPRKRRQPTAWTSPSFYDRDLRRLFSDAPEHAQRPVRGRASSRASASEAAPPGAPLDRRATSTSSTRCSRT